MTPDFFDPLVNELLSEVAGSFFEARRLLDCKIDLFHAHVKRLAQKQHRVSQQAALLNHLLIDERAINTFYRTVAVDPKLFIAAKKIDSDSLSTSKPSGLGVRSKYIRMVLDAYNRLQIACDDYLFGSRRSADPDGSDPTDVYYGLIVSMLEILNQEIEKINCSLSTGCTLQFAKKFHPEKLQKEHITGTGTQSYDAIEKKLLFAPIDLNTLNIARYPSLPPLQSVAQKIERFCKLHYAENIDAIKNLIKGLQDRNRVQKTSSD